MKYCTNKNVTRLASLVTKKEFSNRDVVNVPLPWSAECRQPSASRRRSALGISPPCPARRPARWPVVKDAAVSRYDTAAPVISAASGGGGPRPGDTAQAPGRSMPPGRAQGHRANCPSHQSPAANTADTTPPPVTLPVTPATAAQHSSRQSRHLVDGPLRRSSTRSGILTLRRPRAWGAHRKGQGRLARPSLSPARHKRHRFCQYK